MARFLSATHEIRDAAIRGDFSRVREWVTLFEGSLNVLMSGESLLESVAFEFSEPPKPEYRFDMIRELVHLGADPNLLNEDGASSLTAAMLAMDTQLLDVLLQLGTDPNLPRGFTERQSLYDWGVVDYALEMWEAPLQVADQPRPVDHFPPSRADKVNEDTWLDYLDRRASREGIRRPDYLYLLRKYGALSYTELNERAE